MKNLNLLLLVLFIALVSCTDSILSPEGNLHNQLIGVWKDTSRVIVFKNDSSIDTIFEYALYDLKPDNTYSLKGVPLWMLSDTGTWTYYESNQTVLFNEVFTGNDTFTFDPPVQTEKKWEINSMDDNNLQAIFRMVRPETVYTNQFTGNIDTLSAIEFNKNMNLLRIE